MRVSDYIADFVADLGITHSFGVVGGGCMYLNDSFGHHERMKYVACHHEQAAAMAADAYSRAAGLGCCLVTTGPGGTNAITGVACAWVDSTPVTFISGQVTRDQLLTGVRPEKERGPGYSIQFPAEHTGLRQFGVQESDIVALVKSITKYAVTITDEKDIRYELEKAVYIAKSGRPGPVWIDVPLDVQSKQIEPVALRHFSSSIFDADTNHYRLVGNVDNCLSLLRDAKRPVLIVGNGARGAHTRVNALSLILAAPVISSWSAADMIDSPFHIGHMGLFGDRASNFTVQNADLLLVIGCRLSVPMIGYKFDLFAPNAKIIMVDIDSAEINKPSLHVDLKIEADAKEFLGALMLSISTQWADRMDDVLAWTNQCLARKAKYPVVLPEYSEQKDGINSYHFIDLLSEKLPADAVVVTDMGTAFTGTFQAAKMKLGQRWLTASGHAPMGYGLPGAIGAHYATGKKVICIVGDGSFQFNIQELATIAHHNLPIIIFVLNNQGYLTISAMQDNHFHRRVGSDTDSGVSFPDTQEIARAYRFRHMRFSDGTDFCWLGTILEGFNEPYIVEIMMPPNQPLIPRVQSRKNADGSVSSGDISDMYPFLDRDEYERNML